MINKNRIFIVNDVPISFYEIEQWYNAANLKEKIEVGNIYEFERACYFAAYRIFENKPIKSFTIPHWYQWDPRKSIHDNVLSSVHQKTHWL